jgi:hypothetical protein
MLFHTHVNVTWVFLPQQSLTYFRLCNDTLTNLTSASLTSAGFLESGLCVC